MQGWILTTGIWIFAIIAAYGIKIINPMIEQKIKSIKNAKLRDGLVITDKLAYNSILSLSKMSTMTNSQRKKKAVSELTQQLNERGINLSTDTVSKSIEKVYNQAKKDGYVKNDLMEKVTKDDPEAIEQAKNVERVLNPRPEASQNDDSEAKKIAEQFSNSKKAQELVKGMSNNG